jgi:ATP-binding cassette, subfamily B, bacterial
MSTIPVSDEYKRLSTHEFLNVSSWTFKSIYSLNPWCVIVYAVSTIILRLGEIINTYIIALLTDRLIEAVQYKTVGAEVIYKFIWVIFGYTIFRQIVQYFNRWASTWLRVYQRPILYRNFYKKLKSLGIPTLEHPDVSNKIFRADNALGNMLSFFESVMDIISQIVRLVTVLVIIGGFAPIFIPMIFISVLPLVFWDRTKRSKLYKFVRDNTEEQRKAGASSRDLSNPKELQEIAITQSFNFLDNRYWSFQQFYTASYRKILLTWRNGTSVFLIISEVIVLLAISKVLFQAYYGIITTGIALFRYRTLNQLQQYSIDFFNWLNDLTEQAIKISDVHAIFTMEPMIQDGNKSYAKFTTGPKIVLQSVSFKYPNSENYVIDKLNLDIAAGEKIAIVGANGAGKTTIVKLICKFYNIDSGRILVNGKDLAEFNTGDWHKNIGVLMQDYNRYPQLTVKDNIVIGKPDEPVDEIAVRLAAEQADASEFINAYPHKYDQILSERFKGGIRPSTGQWQKLAIARFFYRNAPLVIFDEPTAAIDAVSEYNIFNRIYEFFKNKTVIIISHRFSTVRNADRIIVLDKGHIIEQGSHEQLMSQKGKYAEAFLLQAKGYEQVNSIY